MTLPADYFATWDAECRHGREVRRWNERRAAEIERKRRKEEDRK